MKATGIVRRIDDLGRVVIPKEIRRTMRIREGDPLEIFTEKDGEVVFKKYSPVGELSPFAVQYADVLSRACNMTVLVCDRDHVIAAAGPNRKDFYELLFGRESVDDGVLSVNIVTDAARHNALMKAVKKNPWDALKQIFANRPKKK